MDASISFLLGGSCVPYGTTAIAVVCGGVKLPRCQ